MAKHPRRERATQEAPKARKSLLRRTAARVRQLFPAREEWRKALPAFGWALLATILLRFAYRPIYWSPVALFALLPLFWGLRRCRPLMAFWVGLLFGTLNGFMFTGWLTVLDRFNPFIYAGVLVLPIWLGLHIAVALSVIVHFGRKLPPWAALGAAMIAWAGMEYFKMVGRLGLPYGFLGHSLVEWTALAQVASIGGVPLLSALIIGMNLSAMETVAAFRARYGHAPALVRLSTMIALVIAGHLWGTAVLSSVEDKYADPEQTTPLRLALVQTGVDQEVKFKSYGSADREERRRLQDEIFVSLLDQLDSIQPEAHDLIITPESSLTNDFADVEEETQKRLFGGVALREIMQRADELRTPIIVGGTDNRFRTIEGEITENVMEGIDPNSPDGEFFPGYDVFGGMWVIRPEEQSVRQVADYRKVRLMPFGEQVPYFDLIPGFQEMIVQVGTFAKGELSAPIGILVQRDVTQPAEEVRIAPTICFEDLFPYIHRYYARQGAQVFVNTTNDGWFDGSAGPAWHMDMARWRSIETHIPMVRATNSGITVVIDEAGRVVEQLPPVEKGILRSTLSVLQEAPRTIYTRTGDWFGLLSLLGSIALLFVLRRREKRVAVQP